jgi:hypothetical protein
MTVQSSKSYSLTHSAGYEGMLVDQQLSNIVSRTNMGTTTIPFGRAIVSQGERGGILPVSGSTFAQFVGISHRELTRAYKEGETFGAIANADFAVVTMGIVYIKAVVTVRRDELVYMLLADGTFTNVATGAILITNAKWMSNTTAGGMGVISLGLGG